jgi:hypothetical protein
VSASWRRLTLLWLATVGSCSHGPPAQVPLGTWGGDGAGLIVSEEGVHVHLGCTKGDIAGRIPLDAAGAFVAEGMHNVDAFPVDLGILHPARYSGRLRGDDRLTFDVTLLDTGEHLGPAEVFRGRQPRLGPCPICR